MNFQKIVLLIASVILLLSLLFVAFAMLFLNKGKKYPPVVGSCPDYWEKRVVNGSQTCVNVKKLGTCPDNMNFDAPPYLGAGGDCSKARWAKGCNLTWDGITNVPDICSSQRA